MGILLNKKPSLYRLELKSEGKNRGKEQINYMLNHIRSTTINLGYVKNQIIAFTIVLSWYFGFFDILAEWLKGIM